MHGFLASYVVALLINLAQLWALDLTTTGSATRLRSVPLVRSGSGVRLALVPLDEALLGICIVGDRWQLQAADSRQNLLPGTRRLLEIDSSSFLPN
ncbi:MAG: hypothetical protein ACYC4L_09725 [Chloroflexota bacterium]